jgi:hypothetical protein
MSVTPTGIEGASAEDTPSYRLCDRTRLEDRATDVYRSTRTNYGRPADQSLRMRIAA